MKQQQIEPASATPTVDRDVPQQVKKPKKSVGFQIADIIEILPGSEHKTESPEPNDQNFATFEANKTSQQPSSN